MAEWFADPDFWAGFAPVMFDGERWAEVPAVVDGIERLAGLRPGAAVLDLCCGPGRHALELAARGYRVTGVDITESFLEAARGSAADRALDIEFVNADARVFERPGAFALCVNLFTSIGYFASSDEDLALVRRVFSSLADGGVFIVETLGERLARRDFVGSERFKREGWTVESRYEPVCDWEALQTRWVITRGTERRERRFVQRLYSEERMESVLGSAGFVGIEFRGSWAGAAYDASATQFIAIARKS
ncbi:MAG: class I SAM-dependent methyltransferase [Spirochaetes bacterium]|nr:class I SAM-dependent methyltransferase [Spirochaetota bacterium]